MTIRVLGFIMYAVGIAALFLMFVALCTAGIGWGVFFALIAGLGLYCGRYWTTKE